MAEKGSAAMTLRELSGKDVIRLKNGENLGRIDDLAFDENGGRLQSVILRGRAHWACWGATMTLSSRGAEHQNHRHGCGYGRCRPLAGKTPPLKQ